VARQAPDQRGSVWERLWLRGVLFVASIAIAITSANLIEGHSVGEALMLGGGAAVVTGVLVSILLPLAARPRRPRP
jgi:hypothetical protein